MKLRQAINEGILKNGAQIVVETEIGAVSGSLYLTSDGKYNIELGTDLLYPEERIPGNEVFRLRQLGEDEFNLPDDKLQRAQRYERRKARKDRKMRKP